jgi:type I restriction enzyme S subunit
MVPYLRAANVTWAGLALDDVKTMNFSDDEVKVYELRDGDILLSEASGSAKEVGKPAMWRNDLPSPVCLQNTLIRVRPKPDCVLTQWLYYRLLQECLDGGFADASRGVGIHHLGAAKLASLPVQLPTLDSQREAADYLDGRFDELKVLMSTVRILVGDVTVADSSLLGRLRRSILRDGLNRTGGFAR